MNILTITGKLNKYMINNIQEYLLPLSKKYNNTELPMKIVSIKNCLVWNHNGYFYYDKIIYKNNKYWTMVNHFHHKSKSKTEF